MKLKAVDELRIHQRPYHLRAALLDIRAGVLVH
jgi:hypothetical protein